MSALKEVHDLWDEVLYGVGSLYYRVTGRQHGPPPKKSSRPSSPHSSRSPPRRLSDAPPSARLLAADGPRSPRRSLEARDPSPRRSMDRPGSSRRSSPRPGRSPRLGPADSGRRRSTEGRPPSSRLESRVPEPELLVPGELRPVVSRRGSRQEDYEPAEGGHRAPYPDYDDRYGEEDIKREPAREQWPPR